MDLNEIFGELAPQIETIVKEKGLNLIVDSKENPNYIPKQRFNEVVGNKNELKTQVLELSTQLESLKTASKGNEELTKQIELLQSKNSEFESKYRQTVLESAIKVKAIGEKAKDPNDLLKFLDSSRLELKEDGSVHGLEDQIKSLKESKSYLFDTGIPNNPLPNPSGKQASNVETYDSVLEQIKNHPNDRTLLQKLFLLKNR